MKASVIVVAHAGFHHLEDSIGSLEGSLADGSAEIIVVDNASPDCCGEAAAERWPGLRVIRSDRNLGFAGGVRLGAEAAAGDVLILLNDDAASEQGFVEAHLDVLADTPNAAATAGRLTSFDGRRHDFVRGAVTFDVHAFQMGQGWPVEEIAPPATGEPLPFACGGNMAIRRAVWEELGGFDDDLFAYFEDVDFGWRLWATGRVVVAAPDAVARHQGSATSAGLGDFRRGVLFERNALRTFFSVADDECRTAFGSSVLATFLHRLSAFAGTHPELAAAAADPFGGAPPPLSRGDRWRRRIAEKGFVGAVRHLMARILLGPEVGSPAVEDGHFLMQLRAAGGFFAGLDETESRRQRISASRTVPDREIIARFPRLVVPTYAGDDAFFSSPSFRSLLPDGWAVEHRRLDEILHSTVLEG